MNVGIMGGALQPYTRMGAVTGYGIAVDNLMKGILRFSTVEKITCLYEPEQYELERIKEIVEILPEERRKKVELISEYEILFHGQRKLPDLSLIHSLRGDALTCLALRESIQKTIPITITFHGISEQRLLLDTFFPMLIFPFQPYDAILCASEAVRQTISQMFQRFLEETMIIRDKKYPQIRLERIPLGIDTEYFHPMDQVEARKEFQIPQDAFVILWLGRFSSIHKADLRPLISVFARLCSKNKDKKLLLILAGPSCRGVTELEKYLEFAANCGVRQHIKVIFHEEIENRARLYSASDVFTSPVDNIQETFGLTPVEAMSCGVPQVVSDWSGYRDTVLDGETGYLIPTAWMDCMDDLKTLDFVPFDGMRRSELYASLVSRSVVVDQTIYEQRLQHLLDHPELIKFMREQSRKRAVACYDERRTIEETNLLWQELCERARVDERKDGFSKMTLLNLCKDFNNYPTRMLSEDTVFTLASIGGHKSTCKSGVAMIPIEEDSLPEQLLERFQTGEDYSSKELSEIFCDFTNSQIRRSVLNLYKNGLIHPAESS